MKRFLLVLCSPLLLSACTNVGFSSNLDKSNFVDYFKPSQVTVYKKSQLTNLDYTFIAGVEGSSCQLEKRDHPADIKQARTAARIKAADLNANGIVFQSCITFEPDAACISNIICYARAFNITLPTDK